SSTGPSRWRWFLHRYMAIWRRKAISFALLLDFRRPGSNEDWVKGDGIPHFEDLGRARRPGCRMTRRPGVPPPGVAHPGAIRGLVIRFRKSADRYGIQHDRYRFRTRRRPAKERRNDHEQPREFSKNKNPLA